jgi:hypothetical protein
VVCAIAIRRMSTCKCFAAAKLCRLRPRRLGGAGRRQLLLVARRQLAERRHAERGPRFAQLPEPATISCPLDARFGAACVSIAGIEFRGRARLRMLWRPTGVPLTRVHCRHVVRAAGGRRLTIGRSNLRALV